MLQHLWTGPISNAAVDVVQGSKSVEVRPVGVSKGAAIERIVTEIANKKPLPTSIDFVLCVGHFLSKVSRPCEDANLVTRRPSDLALVCRASCAVSAATFVGGSWS